MGRLSRPGCREVLTHMAHIAMSRTAEPFHMALLRRGHLWYDSARFVNMIVLFSCAWERTHGDAYSAFR
ncbi:MAG: hypothetical protein LZF62_260045 [Nitrospira sp.]|nr:MAG: hypothetical protein LZF62_260045 [Nitrospira sp.]